MKKNSLLILFFLVLAGLIPLKNTAFADWLCGTFANHPDLKARYFTQAIQKDPDYALAYRSLGWTELRQKNYPAALENFDAALKKNPRDCVSWYSRAEQKKALNDWSGALADLDQALKLNPDYLWAHWSLAECFEHMGNKKAALESQVRYFQKSGELPEALRVLDQFLNRETDKRSRAQVLEWRANVKIETKDSAGALSDLDELILLNPRYARPYFRRGLLKKKLKNEKGTLEDLSRALERDPNFADAYFERGQMQKETAQAVLDFKNAKMIYESQGLKEKALKCQKSLSEFGK